MPGGRARGFWSRSRLSSILLALGGLSCRDSKSTPMGIFRPGVNLTVEAASQLLLGRETQILQKTVDFGDDLLKEELGYTVMARLWSYG